MGALYFFQGDFLDAEKVFEDLQEEAKSRGDRQALVWGLNGAAKAQLQLGRADEALASLEEAGRDMETSSLVTHCGVLAMVHYRLDDHVKAKTYVDMFVDHINMDDPTSVYIVDGLTLALDACLHLWEPITQTGTDSDALDCHSRASTLLQAVRKCAVTFPVAQPRYRFFKGWFYYLIDNRVKAAKHLKKSLQLARDYKMPYEEARARLALARHFAEDSYERNLALATELFEDIGALYDMETAKSCSDAMGVDGANMKAGQKTLIEMSGRVSVILDTRKRSTQLRSPLRARKSKMAPKGSMLATTMESGDDENGDAMSNGHAT
eukprot:GFYU01011453.1.p1 GENE.GFYU01011453.1~~GFYU01011453.1.p1  ORF type:complete len:350 (-),score=106.44 GFYU01011453.1:450-1418(-)